MALFIPIATGVAAILTAALTYETGKNAKRKFERKKSRKKAI